VEYLREYFAVLGRHMEKILSSQSEVMEQAVKAMVECVRRGGVIHVFGAGHSQLVVEEVWYRAGQLACVNPLFDQNLWPHNGPRKGSRLERLEGYGRAVLADQDLRPGEVLVAVSNSGRNAVAVEAALTAKERGVTVVALTSLEYSKSVQSRHSSGRRLFEVADIVIDNQGIPGEAAVRLPGGARAGATTTVTNAAILNAILVQVAGELARQGVEPPLFQSANLDTSSEHNLRLLDRYSDRIPLYKH
jgi:uncharacterized phosphosugar-binding protein